MGQLVKCRDTGQMIPEEEAFTKSKKNAKKKVYYSSEDGFNWWNEWNSKCIDKLFEIALEPGMKFPSPAAKMLIENGNIKHTYMAIELAAKDIEWAVNNKEFQTEWGEWRYIFAIINGHYNEAVKIDKERMREEKKKDYVPEDGSDYMPVRKAKNTAVGGILL